MIGGLNNPARAQEVLAEMVLVALRRIIRATDLRSRELVTRYGLTGPQLSVLRELAPQDGISVGQLTREMLLSQATVTGILDRLARRGLIRRRRSEQDRRRVEVWLTDAGRQMLADAPPLLQEEFIRDFGRLEDWQQSQILSALQRVVSMMEARPAEPRPAVAAGPAETAPGASPARRRWEDRGE
jgi:DNA-binding MarR family transcriptional regulator